MPDAIAGVLSSLKVLAEDLLTLVHVLHIWIIFQPGLPREDQISSSCAPVAVSCGP